MKILGEGSFHLEDLIDELHLTENTKKGVGRLFHIFRIGRKFEEIPRGICGHSRSKTEIRVNRNIDLDLSIHFENLTLKGSNSRLIIREGRITFENVLFDGVSIETYNDSFVSLLGCQFLNTDLPIKAYGRSVINIEGTDTFRYIKGSKIKLYDKSVVRNAKELMNPLKLDILCVLKSISTENNDEVYYFEINKPIIIREDVELGNDRVALLLKLKSLPAFIISDGVKVIFKNVSFESQLYSGSENSALFLLNPSAHLEISNCTLSSSTTIFVVNNAHLDIKECEIKNTSKPAIISTNSSFISIIKSSVNACKGFIEAKGRCHISVENSKFSACLTPLFYVSNNAKFTIKSVDVSGFRGSEYCIVISDSNGFIERLNLSSIKSEANGIHIMNSAKVKIINSVIKDIGGCGIFINENSFAEIVQCNLMNNTKKSGSLAQIWVRSSRANIINSKIERSPNGSGMSISDKSAVYINSSRIINNKGFGIFLDKTSALKADNLRTENNRKGIMSEIGSKLFVEDNCQIKDEVMEEIPLKLNNT